jgi:hypothetical protein
MACPVAKKEGSSRYANSIRARSTRLAGSVRERAITPNAAKSSSPIANSIACRHAAIASILVPNQAASLQAMSDKMNPTHMISFKESMY